MNVTIQKLNGVWHLIVGSCQIRTPFLETQERALVVGTPAGSTRAPRSSNATDGEEGNGAVLTQVKYAAERRRRTSRPRSTCGCYGPKRTLVDQAGSRSTASRDDRLSAAGVQC
jgi:hypothetical protein